MSYIFQETDFAKIIYYISYHVTVRISCRRPLRRVGSPWNGEIPIDPSQIPAENFSCQGCQGWDAPAGPPKKNHPGWSSTRFRCFEGEIPIYIYIIYILICVADAMNFLIVFCSCSRHRTQSWWFNPAFLRWNQNWNHLKRGELHFMMAESAFVLGSVPCLSGKIHTFLG